MERNYVKGTWNILIVNVNLNTVSITLPCWLGGVRGEVTTDVIPCTIPLLLSRKSMKMFGMILDFKNDKISFGSNVSNCIGLRVTSSGHYAVPLTL